MLSDFGLSVERGSRVPVAGTQLYMADELLRSQCAAFQEPPPVSPSHDLESLVKVFFQQTFGSFDHYFQKAGDPPAVLAAWESLAAAEQKLVEALELARCFDYEALKSFFLHANPYGLPPANKLAAV
jgi:hypothetical protein